MWCLLSLEHIHQGSIPDVSWPATPLLSLYASWLTLGSSTVCYNFLIYSHIFGSNNLDIMQDMSGGGEDKIGKVEGRVRTDWVWKEEVSASKRQ